MQRVPLKAILHSSHGSVLGAKDVMPNPRKTAVYSSTAEGTVSMLALPIILKRGQQHTYSSKTLRLMQYQVFRMSRSDARTVEQVLIEYNGLAKDGGSLINKINSISTANPICAESLARGAALLKVFGYPRFK